MKQESLPREPLPTYRVLSKQTSATIPISAGSNATAYVDFSSDMDDDETIIAASCSSTGWAGVVFQACYIASRTSISITCYNTTSSAKDNKWTARATIAKGTLQTS